MTSKLEENLSETHGQTINCSQNRKFWQLRVVVSVFYKNITLIILDINLLVLFKICMFSMNRIDLEKKKKVF